MSNTEKSANGFNNTSVFADNLAYKLLRCGDSQIETFIFVLRTGDGNRIGFGGNSFNNIFQGLIDRIHFGV
ncbi:MAG: hypothetical protein US90_C0011G0005 [Candidatus Shapirobacteria bacterium GW2011_GWE2_38_30]|uniref:Uncharacterized protein n=1 Tax=Candidatus Shapirobacteria bacterium GW2011_GWE2_38_30 TaxID=1618490 RepID=A0A0G0JT11_9BACT|nr:MAG: hypothetical protein US90_C0011G0005 [Candidatus Shapirobacteria bacterium GW2011_GWE2_38_30]